MDYEIQMARLLEITKNIKWATRDILRVNEDPLSDNFWISVFTKEQFKKIPIIQKFLMLTTLPYIISDNDFNVNEKLPVMQEIMKQLWKILGDESKTVGGLSNEMTLPTGVLSPKYFIIGDSPGMSKEGTYDHFGRVFTRGPSSLMIRLATIQAGIYFETWFTNLSKLAMIGNKPTTIEAIESQKEYLEIELELLKPSIIIMLGKHAREMVDLIKVPQVPILQLTHPSYMARTNHTYTEYADGIKTILEYEAGILLP